MKKILKCSKNVKVKPIKVNIDFDPQLYVDLVRIYNILKTTGEISGSRNDFVKLLLRRSLDEYIFNRGIFFNYWYDNLKKTSSLKNKKKYIEDGSN